MIDTVLALVALQYQVYFCFVYLIPDNSILDTSSRALQLYWLPVALLVVLGRVVVVSAREDLTAPLQRLPGRPMTVRLATELIQSAELAKESQLEEI